MGRPAACATGLSQSFKILGGGFDCLLHAKFRVSHSCRCRLNLSRRGHHFRSHSILHPHQLD